MLNPDRWREFYGWGLDRLIATGLYDAINANTVVTAKVAGVKKSLKPTTFPKPWDKPDPSRGISLLEVARAQLAAGRAAAAEAEATVGVIVDELEQDARDDTTTG
jgi:hypothetical protein